MSRNILHFSFYNNIAFDKCPQIANSTAVVKSVLPSRSWLGARSTHFYPELTFLPSTEKEATAIETWIWLN
jgi:hypothetical protein